MPLSAKSLHASGRISDKQMGKLAVLKQTTSQKSKMAPFESKQKGEGALRAKGNLRPSHIDTQHQTKSHMSKGAKAGAEGGTLKRHEIDHQKGGKFPAGGNVRASNPKTGNTRMKGGKMQRSGVVYDTPSRNSFK